MTTALYTASLVRTVMPRSVHTRVHNLPKEAPALASLFDTSLSILQVEVTVLPTLLSFVPSITMFGCEGASPGAGCSNTSVFRRLMVSPKALVAVDRQLPCVAQSAEKSMVANMRLKSVGASTQPCLTPLETGKGSDTDPLSTMRAIIPSWKDLMMLTNLGGQPCLE